MIARIRAGVARWSDRFSFWLANLLAWSPWSFILVAGSALALAWHRNDALMMILTIQTSLDAQATKTMQNSMRARDAQRDDAWRSALEQHLQTIEARDILIEQLLRSHCAGCTLQGRDNA